MSALGKSIDLYLMDGASTGRWQATLSNWNGVSYKIPRKELKDCDDIPELHAPGVYFLFGRDDESDKQFVYVGEGDDVLKRLLQPHTFEKDGTYWTETVVFITPDGTLEKGRIKYLESRFYSIVVESNRYLVKNGNKPPQSPVPRKIQDLLEEFIMNAQLVMPALGHKVFEPRPSKDLSETEDDDLLYFSRNQGKGGRATGKITDDGFWVLQGSYINPELVSYAQSAAKKAREKYASSIDKNGILQEDVPFGSPSTAASFVSGKSDNGLTAWKNKDGVTLKELNGQSSDDDTNPVSKESKKKVKIKEEPESQDTSHEILHLSSKKISARGYVTETGFMVLKGS